MNPNRSTLADVAVDLEDGVYAAPIATLVDRHGRRGTGRLTRFVVDTAVPHLRASPIRNSTTVGLLALVIAGEQGSDVAWTVKNAAGRIVRSASYTAEDTAKKLQWDLTEGAYQVEVTATDENGNQSTRKFVARVSADPVTAGDVVIALITIAVFLILLLLIGWLLWRNRRRFAQ